MSSFTTSTLSKSANVSFNIGINVLSISIATTFSATFPISLVKVPIPGPTSIILSVSDNLAPSNILSITLSSIKKFCPSDFENLKLCLFTTSLVALCDESLSIIFSFP